MGETMHIYAHRGFSGKYPENTMAAFRAAAELKVDGIELDVQMTKDGEVVVIHDERVDRTTNGTGFVKDYTYQELSRFDAGSWFHPDFSNEMVPRLGEVLRFISSIGDPITVNIELKNSLFRYLNLEENVLHEVYRYSLQDRIIISSFCYESLEKVRSLDENISLAFLIQGIKRNAVEKAKAIHADIHCQKSFALSKYGKEAVNEGCRLRVYTVNHVKDYIPLKEANVSAIITDVPDAFISLVNEGAV